MKCCLLKFYKRVNKICTLYYRTKMRLSDGNKCPEQKLSGEQGEISLGPVANVRPLWQQNHMSTYLLNLQLYFKNNFQNVDLSIISIHNCQFSKLN